MHAITPSRKLLLASLALALAPAVPASAQEEGSSEPEQQQAPIVREHPEIYFARTLAYGSAWYDLALDVLDALDKARPPADVAEQALLLRLEIKRTRATAQKDPAKREAELKEVRAAYEELKSKKAGSVAATEAQLALGEMLLQEGDGAFQRVRTTEDPETRAQARKEAEDRYNQAEKYFDTLREEFQKGVDEADKGTDQAKQNAAVFKLMHARFNHARSIFQQAQLFDKGSKEREDRLTKAAKLFEEINLEYADQLPGIDAAIYLGLSAKEVNDVKKALAGFDSAFGIKDWYYNKETGKYSFDAQGQEIVSRASYFKAQTLNEAKDFEGALKAVKDLFELIPDMQRNPLGYAARVEEGKAYAGKGDLKKAQSIFEKIVEEDKGGPWAASAKEALAIAMGGSGGASMSVAPDRSLASAETLIDRGRPAEGLNQIRNLIASLEQAAPEEQQKWLPTAWLKLGAAYNGLKRYDEAAAAFDALVQRFKSSDLASSALFQAAMARLQLLGVKPNEFDKKAYNDTLDQLKRDYPNDPAAKAASFFSGIQRFAERDFAAAAKEFAATTEAAGKLYDAALYQAGLSYVMEGRRLAQEKKGDEAKANFEKARGALEKAIAWASEGAFGKGIPKEGERADAFRRLAFDARCRLAEVSLHPLTKDVPRALQAAEAAERGLATGADPERVAEARLLKVQAHLAADDLAKAEEVAASMTGESPKTAQAEREVAVASDNDAKKAKPEEARPLFAKAADHYTRWFETARKAGLAISGKDYAKAADKLYSLALIVNGLPESSESFVEVEDLSKLEAPARFTNAAAVYQGAIDEGAPDPWQILIKLGGCHGLARDFEKARKALFTACESQKLLIVEKEKDAKGKEIRVVSIDVAVAQAKPLLLFAYSDYARATFELVAKDRSLLDEAIDSFGRVLAVAPAGQPIWWRAKYYLFAGLYEKGEYDDTNIGLKQLERQNPGFDEGKYGLKDKFLALKAKLEGKKSPGKAAPPAGGKKTK